MVWHLLAAGGVFWLLWKLTVPAGGQRPEAPARETARNLENLEKCPCPDEAPGASGGQGEGDKKYEEPPPYDPMSNPFRREHPENDGSFPKEDMEWLPESSEPQPIEGPDDSPEEEEEE